MPGRFLLKLLNFFSFTWDDLCPDKERKKYVFYYLKRHSSPTDCFMKQVFINIRLGKRPPLANLVWIFLPSIHCLVLNSFIFLSVIVLYTFPRIFLHDVTHPASKVQLTQTILFIQANIWTCKTAIKCYDVYQGRRAHKISDIVSPLCVLSGVINWLRAV